MKSNRTVVITGAAGGMGSLVVARFLANGDTVIATDCNEEGLATLRAAYGADIKLQTAAGDVTSEKDCQAVADVAKKATGRVDVFVSVAGYFPTQSFDNTTAADFRRVVDINLTGAFLMIKAIHPLMKGRGWGRIVIIGSASTFEGIPDQIHYVAAKAGLFGLARSLAREFGKDGITVNVVTPGLTLTPIVKKTSPSAVLELQPKTRSIPRDERPEDLVGPIFYLASPDSDFISGQTVNVDGGKHMV
jgi:NAD(P)-dependent dehydrogenase (short-subunit alcohol dehydrogenase family)